MLKQKLLMPCLIAGTVLLSGNSSSFATDYVIHCPSLDKIECFPPKGYGHCTATVIYDQNNRYHVDFQGFGRKGHLDEATLVPGSETLECIYNGGQLRLSGIAHDPLHPGQELQCDVTPGETVFRCF